MGKNIQQDSRLFSVRDLPPSERPRERLMRLGASSLSDGELLSILLSGGTKKAPVNHLSQSLLAKFGSLKGILKSSIQEMSSVNGIGRAKACLLSACYEVAIRIESGGNNHYANDEFIVLDGAVDVCGVISPIVKPFESEHFLVISVDARQRLIAVDDISKGTVNESLVHPREVFKTAISRLAARVFVAHNHPSGDSYPSHQDISITERLIMASKIVGIPLLDHVIMGKSGYYSFKDSGRIY